MLLTSSDALNYLIPSDFDPEFYSLTPFINRLDKIVSYLTDSVQAVGAFVSYIIGLCPIWLKYCFGFCLCYLILLSVFRLLKEL